MKTAVSRIKNQAKSLVESAIRKYRREGAEYGGKKRIHGCVVINIDGTDYEYAYEAVVELEIEHWRERRPRGPGWSSSPEEMAEVHNENIVIEKVESLDGGPENGGEYSKKLDDLIRDDVDRKNIEP